MPKLCHNWMEDLEILIKNELLKRIITQRQGNAMKGMI